MSDRQIPHDKDAERALLGAMMLTGDALAGGVESITVGDFYIPAHGLVFAAMVGLYRRGEPVEALTVAHELRCDGFLDRVGGLVELTAMTADCGSTTSARRYAAIIARHSLARRLIAAAADFGAEAYRPDVDPYELVEQFGAQLSGLHTPVNQAPGDVRTWDDFWSRPGETHKPWAISGMIRVGWRAVVVAKEGSGKTVMTSGIALCAGQGIHPFTFAPIEPIRTLFVDLENPEEHLDLRRKLIRGPLIQTAGDMYRADQTWLWHRPGGVNLRSRQGASQFEAAIRHIRPQLVVVAPVYKMFRSAKGETDEQATGEVQQTLDDLRTRYDFALILEHHAPKGIVKARDMVPFGSSLWLRWPELGIALLPVGERGDLKVDRYRPDRLPCRWPDELHRGNVWPWVGYYQGGIPQEPVMAEEAF